VNTDNSLDLVESLLVERFNSLRSTITPPIPTTSIHYPNAPWATPNNAAWVRINSPINFGPIEQDASGCYEINSGIMVFQVFFPKGTGSKNAMSVAQQIKGFYTAEVLGDLVVESVVVSPAPEPESSPWYGINCQVNFTFEGYTS
jgi:hypothetical protein